MEIFTNHWYFFFSYFFVVAYCYLDYMYMKYQLGMSWTERDKDVLIGMVLFSPLYCPICIGLFILMCFSVIGKKVWPKKS